MKMDLRSTSFPPSCCSSPSVRIITGRGEGGQWERGEGGPGEQEKEGVGTASGEHEREGRCWTSAVCRKAIKESGCCAEINWMEDLRTDDDGDREHDEEMGTHDGVYRPKNRERKRERERGREKQGSESQSDR